MSDPGLIVGDGGVGEVVCSVADCVEDTPWAAADVPEVELWIEVAVVAF
jgi:hypothetical protein